MSGSTPPAPGVVGDDTAEAAVAAAVPAEERILRATMAALAALDPGALTIKQICGAAAVTPPTLYYHFGSKDGLVAAAVERLVAEWLLAMDATVSRDAPLSLQVDQAVAGWMEAITAPARPLAVWTWATLLLADSSELARQALVQARDQGRAMIADVLARHVAPELVEPIAGLVVDSVIASAVQYELDRDPSALRRRLDALGAMVRVVAGLPLGAA